MNVQEINMDNKLISLLESDTLMNLAAIGFFENYAVEAYFTEGNSTIIFGKSDHLWTHISSSSEEELKILLDKYHEKTKYYFSVEDWMIPHILKFGDEDWRMTTNRYVLEQDFYTELPKRKVLSLDISYSDYIYDNSDYQDLTSVDYIKDRLSKDISAGIWVDDKLAAWGFTHDDGAFGFLKVLDEYRNRGYGTDILLGLIQMKRKNEQPIFANIRPDNIPSIKLLTKIGFKIDRKVSWMKLK